MEEEENVGETAGRKIQSLWLIKFISERGEEGNPAEYRNFLRIRCLTFDELLDLVHEMLKQDTTTKIAILVTAKLERT